MTHALIMAAEQVRIQSAQPIEYGFLGEVPARELISGNALASAIVLTAGIAQHTNEPWLKFNLDGKTLYVAKKSYRHSISWDQIHARGAVFGTRTVTINGDTYKVRLLTGADTNPTPVTTGYSSIGTSNSEWERLIYAVHNGVHTNTSNRTPPGAWPLYSDADLLVYNSYGHGNCSWTQETGTANVGQRVFRGGAGVTYFALQSSSNVHTQMGWRPVLELVE